jgi:hypothetical protein
VRFEIQLLRASPLFHVTAEPRRSLRHVERVAVTDELPEVGAA